MDESNIREEDRGPSVPFVREKTGTLLDVGWVHDMPGFIRSRQTHRLTFYDVMLVTDGVGELVVGDGVEPLRPGAVLFTAPDQPRQWRAEDVDGLCCFFPTRFFGRHTRAAALLRRTPMFGDEAVPARIDATPSTFGDLRRGLTALKGSLDSARTSRSHARLRGTVHGLLEDLDRRHRDQHESALGAHEPNLVGAFQLLVARRFGEERRLSAYADWLGVSPPHLSRVCRETLGMSGGRVIRRRVALEARALLRDSDSSVARIGRELGFFDPFHFSRFFKRETGVSPTSFRTGSVAGRPNS